MDDYVNACEIQIRLANHDSINVYVYQYQLAEIFYFNSRLDDIFKIPKLEIKSALALVSNVPISSLYIQKLFDTSIEKEVDLDVYSILSSIISAGNLPIIKFLNLNYSYLFSKSTKATSDGILDFRELKNLLSTAILNDFIQIIEILLLYANLSRNEFEKLNMPSDSLVVQHLWDSFKFSSKK